MSKPRIPATWPLLLLALPAGVATWSGWVGLGELTGFGPVKPLPGISEFTINTAITLPIGVEAYAGYALHAWLSSRNAAEGTRRFAKYSALGALLLGMLGQVAYHLLAVRGVTTAPWQVTTAVSCLPVLVLGMGAALGHMLARDAHAVPATEEISSVEVEAVAVPAPVQVQAPEPVSVVTNVTSPAAEDADWECEADRLIASLFGDQVHAPAVPAQVTGSTLLAGEQRATYFPEVEGQPDLVPDPDVDAPYRPVAVAQFLAEVAQGEPPTVRAIKDRMNVGTDRARRLQAYLGQLVTASA